MAKVPEVRTMDPRRALALSVVALDYVADEAHDVEDWRQAAQLVRLWLTALRGESTGRWFQTTSRRTKQP